MSDPTSKDQDKTPQADKAGKPLTAAEAAKRVKRAVTELVDGKDADGAPAKVARTRQVAVGADEVLSFRDYGSHVVVVTRDGQKFSSVEA